MPKYPHDYDWGELNPWAKKLLGSSIAGGLGFGGQTFNSALAAAGTIHGYVLYAAKEMVERDQYTSHDPTNARALKQELVHVRVRIPELHTKTVPRFLPPNNDETANADWDAINQYPYFVATDPTAQLPSPGDVVRVDFRNRLTQDGPIYLGPNREAIRPKPIEMPPTPASEGFPRNQSQNTLADSNASKPNNTLLGDISTPERAKQFLAEFDGPHPISKPLIPTVGQGAISFEVTYRQWDPITGFGKSYSPLKTDDGDVIEKNLLMQRHPREDNRTTQKRTTAVGGTYPQGLKYPATQIVIHEPSLRMYYPSQKHIRNTLLGTSEIKVGSGAGAARPKARGVGVHYTITNSMTGDASEPMSSAGAGDWHVNEHVSPAKWHTEHGGPFNSRSVSIELCRPTFKKGPANNVDTFPLPRWWGPYENGTHNLWLPRQDMGCFEKLTQLIYSLATHPRLFIPLQFPGVEIKGVDINLHDETNQIPMADYSKAKFHWGNPALEGHHADYYKNKSTNSEADNYHKKAWSRQYAIGNRAQSPSTIVGYDRYARSAAKHERRNYGKYLPTHPQNYSRGIMAHARWAHSDALPAEYYVLMRFMGYSPNESYTLLIEAIKGLSDQKNWTTLPQAITHGAERGEPPRLI